MGGSANPARYSYLAIESLRAHGHTVIAIGKHTGKVADVEIRNYTAPIPDLDTVTLYLNARNQQEYYQYILEQKPRRIIFNPGAENKEFVLLAREHNILLQNACTLMLLSAGQY